MWKICSVVVAEIHDNSINPLMKELCAVLREYDSMDFRL